MSVVPDSWMQPCRMKAIVFHWSAGPHKVTEQDKEHYHIIVAGDGTLVKGDHDISDNVNTRDDDYAAHTRHFNTNTIGVSMACMMDARESPFYAGPFPMTERQWDMLAKVIADLCRFYKIPVTPQTVLSHAEVQPTLGIVQRGKWDVARLPFDATVIGHKACGDKMRRQVLAAMAGPPSLSFGANQSPPAG